MILIKGRIDEKLSPNEYHVTTQEGIVIQASFPRKYLMNYMNISIDDEVFIILPSIDSVKGRFATKLDFINHPNLNIQKQKINGDKSSPTV